MKKTAFLLALILCLGALVSCGEEGPAENPFASAAELSPYTRTDQVTNFVRLDLSNGGSIVIELYPEIAPITVENFQKLVGEGYYNGIIFHRVISGFMIQTGDPQGTGAGGPGYTIKGEFTANGWQNDLKHTRGVVSMARRGGNPDSAYYDTAGSQFFIMHTVKPSLDGKYAAFGKVLVGLDVVDAIAASPTDARDRPVDPVSMTEVYFVTKGE